MAITRRRFLKLTATLAAIGGAVPIGRLPASHQGMRVYPTRNPHYAPTLTPTLVARTIGIVYDANVPYDGNYTYDGLVA